MTTPLIQFTRLIDEAFNAGNLAVLDDLVSPDLVERQFESPQHPARVTGPAGVARIITELRAGADDFHLSIEDVSVTGDTVWAGCEAPEPAPAASWAGRRPANRSPSPSSTSPASRTTGWSSTGECPTDWDSCSSSGRSAAASVPLSDVRQGWPRGLEESRAARALRRSAGLTSTMISPRCEVVVRCRAIRVTG